jgi:phosphate transport system substrate-binding protein
MNRKAAALVMAALVLPATLTACERAGGGQVGASCGGTKSLKASGSSAQANTMALFVTAYEKACRGYTLSYTATGSAAGISEFISGQTDFGASDLPMNPRKGQVYKARVRCGDNDAWYLPMVFGAIAITYNLPGVDSLVLDGPTTAMIFNGTIMTWNDRRIAALNPGRALPSQPIAVVFRRDQSGITENFQKYLDRASRGLWGMVPSKTFTGGVGRSADGSAGMAAAVKATAGSISYNEWSFARGQDLSIARLHTSAGTDPVTLSAESVARSVAGVVIRDGDNSLLLDTEAFYSPTQAGAYPIVQATYEIVCSKYPDSDVAAAVKAFLTVALEQGQADLAEAGFTPVPASLKPRLKKAIDAIS